MAEDPLPSTDPRTANLVRQKMILTISLLMISVSAILTLFILRRFPLPVRVFLVVGDMIVLSAIWLILRQKFSGK